VYAIRTWKKHRSLAGGFGVISPDSRWLARDDRSGIIRLEGLKDGQELGVLEPPDPGTHSGLVLTADGSRLIAPKNGADPCIHVWDLRLIGQRLRERGLGQAWPTFAPAAPAPA